MIYKAVMALMVITLFGMAISLSECRDQAFQAKIEESERKLQEMADEHARSIEIAQRAMARREEVLEREREKVCRAQAAMGENSDFCDMDIPDSLRLLFEENAGTDHDSLPATGNPAPAN